MQFFICHIIEDQTHRRFFDDREAFLSFLNQAACSSAQSESGFRLDQMEEVPSLEQAQVYVVLSGMYLTWGYPEVIRQELEQARQQGKRILVVRPYGTGYVPVRLRSYADAVCDLTQESIQKVLPLL